MKYAILVWPITGAPLPPHQEDGSSTQGPQTPSIGAPGSTPGKCFFDVTMKSGSMVRYRLWFSENWGCSCNQTVCISLQETACSRDYNTSTEDTPELGTELTACYASRVQWVHSHIKAKNKTLTHVWGCNTLKKRAPKGSTFLWWT